MRIVRATMAASAFCALLAAAVPAASSPVQSSGFIAETGTFKPDDALPVPAGQAQPVSGVADQNPEVLTETQDIEPDRSTVLKRTQDTASDPNASGTITVFGVTWESKSADFHVEMRSKRNDGSYGKWEPVPLADDTSDDSGAGGDGNSTEAVVVDPHETVEVRTSGAATVSISTTQQTAEDRVLAGAVQDKNADGLTQTNVSGVGLALTPESEVFESAYTGTPGTNSPAPGTNSPATAATAGFAATNTSAVTGSDGNFAAAATAQVDGLEYVTRRQWGAHAPKCDVSTAKSNKGVVIHHTDGANGYSKEDVPGILRGIQSYHQNGRGWCDIGYNMLIDRFGNAYEGRANLDKATVGAHAVAVNDGTFGVSVIGTYTKKAPEPVIAKLSSVVAWQAKKWGWKVNSEVTYTSAGGPGAKWGRGTKKKLPRVIGHRDVGFTDCPGDGLYSQLGEIRDRAAQGGGYATKGAIGAFYKQNSKLTGAPVDEEKGGLRDGGYYQSFANGAVHWSAKTGAHFTRFDSPMFEAWKNQDFEEGKLGYPIAEEESSKDRITQKFEGGSIVWTKKGGAKVELTSLSGGASDLSGGASQG